MINWQTSKPVKYKHLTTEQKRLICNGCGGKGGLVKPPRRIFFKASCNHHDYLYWCGGTEADRLKADKRLYELMVEDCADLTWGAWLKHRPWCWAYYRGVRMAGKKFFRFSKKRWPVV